MCKKSHKQFSLKSVLNVCLYPLLFNQIHEHKKNILLFLIWLSSLKEIANNHLNKKIHCAFMCVKIGAK